MKAYFLALVFSNLNALCNGNPAKRICLEPGSSNAPHADFSLPANPRAKSKRPRANSNIPCAKSNVPGRLCDSCFSRANDHFNGAAVSSGSNSQELYQYLKSLNGNYNCYKLAENGNYKDAIEILLASGQKTLFSAIYDLNFENRKEMLQFKEFLKAYCAPDAHPHCQYQIGQVTSLYEAVMKQAFMTDEDTPSNPEGRPRKKRHAYYYCEYRNFIKISQFGRVPATYLIDIQKKIKGNALTTNSAENISHRFYDSFLSKLAISCNLTDEIVSRALSPFVYHGYFNRHPFNAVSARPVHALISYQAKSAEHQAKIDNALKTILLDKARLAAESVYSLLETYKISERLSLSLFTEYTILVHDAILKRNAIQSGEEKGVFLKLHYSLITQFLPLCRQEPTYKENLVCFEELKAGIPALSGEIDRIELSLIREGYCNDDTSSSASIVAKLYDCWKSRDFEPAKSLFSRAKLSSEQTLNLLRAISAQRFELGIKLSILRELVKCDVLAGKICGYISKSLRSSEPGPIIIYALGLISCAYKAREAGQTVKSGILEAYSELCAAHPPIFAYSDGPHRPAEYYVLHAYDSLFSMHYSDNEEYRIFWKDCVLPGYQLSFFTSLWDSLNCLSNAPREEKAGCGSPGSAPMEGEGELDKMKIWAFAMIRRFAQANNDPGALGKTVHDLFRSNLGLPKIFTCYFQSDPRYADYLIAKYFFYCSEAMCRGTNYKICYEYLAQNRAGVIEYLGGRARLISRNAENSSLKMARLRISIHRVCKTIYVLGVTRAIEHDSELCRFAEKMVLDILDVLLSNTAREDGSGISRELQAMQAISRILSRREKGKKRKEINSVGDGKRPVRSAW